MAAVTWGDAMRSKIELSALFALALVAGACASTPPIPANMPPSLTIAELRPIPGVQHSDVIEATGAATINAGDVSNGDAVISFPYRYRHTAVLTEDVRGYSITVGGVQAPAGSPGYYAGTFRSVGGPVRTGPSDLWCFLPSLAGGERENICLLRSSGALAAIAPTRLNPYLWRQFAPATGTFDYVHTPIFERRQIEIPGDLRIEYRFERWASSYVRLGEYTVGRQVGDLTLPVDSSGVARLRTVGGDVYIARVPGNDELARVSATAP
jgi:hypothetical protein